MFDPDAAYVSNQAVTRKLKNEPQYFKDFQEKIKTIRKLQRARRKQKKEIDSNYETFRKEKILRDKSS